VTYGFERSGNGTVKVFETKDPEDGYVEPWEKWI
jgi:hypothetical protein